MSQHPDVPPCPFQYVTWDDLVFVQNSATLPQSFGQTPECPRDGLMLLPVHTGIDVTEPPKVMSLHRHKCHHIASLCLPYLATLRVAVPHSPPVFSVFLPLVI